MLHRATSLPDETTDAILPSFLPPEHSTVELVWRFLLQSATVFAATYRKIILWKGWNMESNGEIG